MTGSGKREPIFNVPSAVVAVLGVMVAVHVVRQFLSEEDEVWLLLALAFIPARYAGVAAELPGGETASITSFLTHMLVHGDLTHLLFNAAWLLAFGGAIAQRVGSARFLAFAILTGFAGAAAFLAVNPGLLAPMIGASGAIAGLMGGAMRFVFSAIDRGGFGELRENPAGVPLMPLGAALTDRRILLTTGLWLMVNALALLGLGGVESGTGIAWEAHIGGYFAGLVLFGLFDRPTSRPAREIQSFH